MSGAPPDPFAILDVLGIAGPVRATPVSGGADTVIWRIETSDRTSALRLFRPEQAAVARREVAAMTAAVSAGLPVPRVSAEGTWHDRPALLLSWMPGRPLRDELVARPWRAWSLGVRFGQTQAAIHAVAAPQPLRDETPTWIDWAQPDAALRDRLLALADQSHCLLHLDYHPMNVLVAGGKILAVLDWANARAGDRRADVARTASILHFAPRDPAQPPLLGSLVRRSLIAGWRRGYRQIAGPISSMAPFYAWAGRVMIRDLTPRLGRSDLPWLTGAFLDEVERWAAGWRARAGLSAEEGLGG
jgi:aminoglycoside phosphotransferase (APT) family kinase protein